MFFLILFALVLLTLGILLISIPLPQGVMQRLGNVLLYLVGAGFVVIGCILFMLILTGQYEAASQFLGVYIIT